MSQFFDYEEMDPEGAWQYAYTYYRRRNNIKDAVYIVVSLVSLLLAVGALIYERSNEVPLELYVKICGWQIIGFVVCAVAIWLHHRIECHAHTFACEVEAGGVFCKTDIRALYDAWYGK